MTTDTPPTPDISPSTLSPPRPVLAERLIAAFEPFLGHDPAMDAPAMLEEHVRLLDLTFRRALCAADGKSYLRDDHYRLALRAQSQCRATMKTLSEFQKNDEQTDK